MIAFAIANCCCNYELLLCSCELLLCSPPSHRERGENRIAFLRDLSQRIFFFSVVTAAAATATGGTVLFGVVEAERHVVGAAFGGGSGVVDKAQTAVGEEADVHFVDVLYGAFFRTWGSFAVESGVEHTEAVQFLRCRRLSLCV